MFLASEGPPDLTLALVVAGGGALAAAGANALNHFLDRDIDARMRRTRNRPVAALRVQPRGALLFGIVTNVVAFALFATLANPLSAVLTLCATLFYVFVYTMGLKRSTPQNIVIGGAAGGAAARHRLGRGDRQPGASGGLHVRHHLLLDAAALLGAGAAAQGRLC